MEELVAEVKPSVTGEIWVSSAPRSTTIPECLNSENKWRLAYFTNEILLQFKDSKQYSARFLLISIYSFMLSLDDFSEKTRVNGTSNPLRDNFPN
jgi:hypothetical protein